MELTAYYGSSEDAIYTINFIGKDEDGEADILLNPDNNSYDHNARITAPQVPQEIENRITL